MLVGTTVDGRVGRHDGVIEIAAGYRPDANHIDLTTGMRGRILRGAS